MSRAPVPVLLLLLVLFLVLPLGAQEKPVAPDEKKKALDQAAASAADPLSFDRNVRNLFKMYCYDCHNAEKRKGDVDLQKDENPRLIAANRKVWLTALDALEQRQMPPKKAKQPPEPHRKILVDFIRKTMGSLDCSKPSDPGKPTLRRLNRAEYNNTVAELTGLPLRPADDFSPDETGYGFDNIGDVLAMSPVLVEQYHGAARKVAAEIFQRKDALERLCGSTLKDREAAREIAARFASRAFRRPADPAFVDRLLAVYDKARSKGAAHEAALRPIFEAVLISPRFLMRIETSRPESKEPYPVDDYDVASRLSYFLWSGPPDELLLSLAAKGALNTPEALEAQARRMLADPRARALVDNFFGQWLQLRGLAAHQPDAKRFPDFNDALRAAMQQELVLFLGEIVREDRPLTDLIDADYSYVNEALARHYGLPGVSGKEFRRVTLPDRRRGGVLTSAAVLMLQSDPERINIPRRGNYIAGSILGAKPPPPPPDIPALEDSKAAGKTLTIRQMLELHRSKPDCAGCHSRIDPLGFAFQNYDAIGRWRDQEDGAPVDASAVLPDGKTFSGSVELKQILLARRDDFARTLTENLLIYAMGRGLQPEDDCVVRAAREGAQAGAYKFSALIVAIVRSHPFRYRRNPDF